MQNQAHSSQTFMILPSERLIKYSSNTDNFTLLSNTKAQDFVSSPNKLAIIVGKSVKCYNTTNGFTQSLVPQLQSYFPKKVQALTMDLDNNIVVTDKFGDIYVAKSQNSTYLNSNLGIPTFMKHVTNGKKEFIVLGDDYCKIKVYNYRNMHQVTAIWYIANCVPLELVQLSDGVLVLLVKHEDKENVKNTYKLYQFNAKDLEEPDFTGSLIYADKTQTLNNSQYHPCSVTYDSHNHQLHFLKLHEESIQIVTFSLKNGSLTQSSNKSISSPVKVKEGNSIEGITVKNNQKSCLIVSYGKYHNVEVNGNQEGQNKKASEVQIGLNTFQKNNEGTEFYKINDNQILTKLSIQ